MYSKLLRYSPVAVTRAIFKGGIVVAPLAGMNSIEGDRAALVRIYNAPRQVYPDNYLQNGVWGLPFLIYAHFSRTIHNLLVKLFSSVSLVLFHSCNLKPSYSSLQLDTLHTCSLGLEILRIVFPYYFRLYM